MVVVVRELQGLRRGMQSYVDVESAAHGVKCCGQPRSQTRVRQHLLTIANVPAVQESNVYRCGWWEQASGICR